MLSFSGKLAAQLLIDYGCQSEVTEIVNNYRQGGTRHFTIHYWQQFNNQRPSRDRFRYTFLNDSLLLHKYKHYSQLYHLKNGEYETVLHKLDSIRIEHSLRNYFTTTKDSLGYQVTKTYHLKDYDTSLVYVYTIKSEADSDTVITKDYSFQQPSIQMKVTNMYEKENKRIRRFMWRNDQWVFFTEEWTTVTFDQKNKTKTILIHTLNKQFGDGNTGELMEERETYRTSVFIFNNSDQIEQVEIVEKVDGRTETTLLTVDVKK